ncbi:hypothetical protein lacNasYZ03_14650 [Lactobacillus nasalidis]|uniref:Uncharacterized protein n=1 Tax=Lactobacillus nasalidis TaxID=2797258 RepID=A0ABQ3W5F1_9LACO|nr:hypothetical protein lacNasYZ01_11060 [Lactobacillus nasalidis]GHW01778.1 hypothetical protein lacNasYZ03_14650 [Lactobacillus nasalidis]
MPASSSSAGWRRRAYRDRDTTKQRGCNPRLDCIYYLRNETEKAYKIPNTAKIYTKI